MEDSSDNEAYLSTLYHALRARRRRQAIHLVHATDAPALSVRTLAREVAAAESGLPRAHATGEPYRNAYNALAQTHLPTLADAGIVIYDPKRQIVSPGPNLTLAALLVAIDDSVIETLRDE